MKNTWIFGDTHGSFDQLKNCIESINLQKGDRVIGLGDYVDRNPQSFEVVEYLLKLEQEYDCIFIKGNHDEVWLNYLKTGKHEWGFHQGGQDTLNSYINNDVQPEVHFDFFSKLKPYFIDENMNLFVHGGFNRHEFIEEQKENVLLCDRDLIAAARSWSSMKNNEYLFKIKGSVNGKLKEVFIGHTPCQYFDSNTPLHYANIWLLDTGAGKFYPNGTITIMNIETKEFKQF